MGGLYCYLHRSYCKYRFLTDTVGPRRIKVVFCVCYHEAKTGAESCFYSFFLFRGIFSAPCLVHVVVASQYLSGGSFLRLTAFYAMFLYLVHYWVANFTVMLRKWEALSFPSYCLYCAFCSVSSIRFTYHWEAV